MNTHSSLLAVLDTIVTCILTAEAITATITREPSKKSLANSYGTVTYPASAPSTIAVTGLRNTTPSRVPPRSSPHHCAQLDL
jgi:hypothetical protein